MLSILRYAEYTGVCWVYWDMLSILEHAEYTGVCWVYWSMLSILKCAEYTGICGVYWSILSSSKFDLVLGWVYMRKRRQWWSLRINKKGNLWKLLHGTQLRKEETINSITHIWCQLIAERRVWASEARPISVHHSSFRNMFVCPLFGPLIVAGQVAYFTSRTHFHPMC